MSAPVTWTSPSASSKIPTATRLKALGDTLDDLLARLEASFQAQRHFVADASHELRTPLTRERTMLQVASSEGGLEHREPVDLSAVTGAVLLTPRPEIGRLGLQVEAITQSATLHGDPVLVERLVANLVDNAVRHNIPGGSVQVTTSTDRGRAVLSVASTGPVIPPGQVDRLFQPFQEVGVEGGAARSRVAPGWPRRVPANGRSSRHPRLSSGRSRTFLRR